MTTKRLSKKERAKRVAVARLRTIQEKITDLLDEVETLIARHADRQTLNQARAYWLAHARIALVEEHEYLASDDDSLTTTIREMEGEEEEEESPVRKPDRKRPRKVPKTQQQTEQIFSVDKVSEGGMGQRVAIHLLKAEGIHAEPCHSVYVGQSGVRVVGTDEQIKQAEEILFG